MDFSDFEPEKIWPGNFHSKNFCDFQLSHPKFSGKKNFAAKKSTRFLILVPGLYRRIYDGSQRTLQIVFAFSQLSRQLFLDFSTFDRKNFGFWKFQTKKNTAKKNFMAKRSGRTNIHAKIFWPKKISDRTGMTRSAGSFSGWIVTLRQKIPLIGRVFPDFASNRPGFFGRESS